MCITYVYRSGLLKNFLSLRKNYSLQESRNFDIFNRVVRECLAKLVSEMWHHAISIQFTCSNTDIHVPTHMCIKWTFEKLSQSTENYLFQESSNFDIFNRVVREYLAKMRQKCGIMIFQFNSYVPIKIYNYLSICVQEWTLEKLPHSTE